MYREDGVGDDMMISLLTYGNLKLQRLAMSYNRITSNATTQLSEFLANDPPLKWLELEGNRLVDNDAELLADALRSNSSLRHLALRVNTGITYMGGEAFHTVLYDDSTLNAVSDSNHSCCVKIRDQQYWNNDRPWDMIRSWDMKDLRKETAFNRAQKIYRLLSSRNKSLSNVQHFDDTDVKILPNMIEAVHRCRSLVEELGFDPIDHVNSLSIVYEVMRKWEKVFPLYNIEGRDFDPQQRETHDLHLD
jgi:Leucine-rich repeat (LRR) protein